MKLVVEKEKCSGCHLCEMVCSLAHLGVINSEKSAIRIEKDDLVTSMNKPVVCRQCKKMKCLGEESASAELEKQKFLWNKERSQRCSFKALPSFEDSAYHCDLCGGAPECVKVCTTGAITVSSK